MSRGNQYLMACIFACTGSLLWMCSAAKPLWALGDMPHLVAEAETVAMNNEPATIEEKEMLPAEPAPAVYADDRTPDMKKFTIIGNLDAAYSLSDRSGKSTLSGGDVSGFIAPRYQFSDSFYATLSYDGQYYKRRDYYSDAVGPKERTEFQRHTVTPSFRIDLGENYRYSLTPSFFYTRTYNKDTDGGDWDDGLYNYKDIGGGLDFRMRQLGFGGREGGVLRLGAQYYKREYPNYTSLLDLAAGIGIEEDERDYKGWLGRIRYTDANQTGFSWRGGYTLLYKRLDDKKIVDSDGVLSSDEQRDFLHSLDFGCWYVPEMIDGLHVGIDVSGSFNRSNQNYYDGQGTISLADDVFLPDYYDYDLFRVGPNISYRLSTIPLTISCYYSYQRTDYTDRKAENSDGTYKNDTQYEDQQSLGAGLRYALLDDWNIYIRWQYVEVDSNNDNESVYDYRHEVNNYYAGTTISF